MPKRPPEPPHRSVRPARHPAATAPLPRLPGTGFSAEGPGFYVWDDVASETLRAARELGSIGPARPKGARR